MSLRKGYPRIFHSYFKTSKGTAQDEQLDDYFLIKYYDAVGEISDEDYTDCIRTEISFDPLKNFQIHHAMIKCIEDSASEINCAAMLLPNIPEEVGGSIKVVSNKKLSNNNDIVSLFSVPKDMPFDMKYTSPSPSTTEILLSLTHQVGVTTRFEFELYTFGLVGG